MMRRPQSELPVAMFSSIQLWTTVVALILAPLFFGSIDLFWIVVWAILLSISVLCGVAAPMDTGQSRVLFGFFALCGIYTLVAIVQITPHVVDQLNDPSWRQANDLLGLDALPRISSRAEMPPLAVGHFLLFATSFISGFFIGTSRRNSDSLIWFAQYSILLYAIYGLAALILTPNMVLWAPKLAYRGSLTATFINHNTAATFIGAGAILWFCSAFSSLQQSSGFSSIRLLLLNRANEHLAFSFLARSGAALTCFFALLLTGSRGGLICTCFGLLVAIILMVANRQKPRFRHMAGWGAAALAVTVVLLSRMGRIGSQGLFDDGRWSVYGFCVEAIRQRPLLGAERPVGHDHAKVRREPRRDVAPELAVHEQPVDEHDRPAAAVILVVDLDRSVVLGSYGDARHAGLLSWCGATPTYLRRTPWRTSVRQAGQPVRDRVARR